MRLAFVQVPIALPTSSQDAITSNEFVLDEPAVTLASHTLSSAPGTLLGSLPRGHGFDWWERLRCHLPVVLPFESLAFSSAFSGAGAAEMAVELLGQLTPSSKGLGTSTWAFDIDQASLIVLALHLRLSHLGCDLCSLWPEYFHARFNSVATSFDAALAYGRQNMHLLGRTVKCSITDAWHV